MKRVLLAFIFLTSLLQTSCSSDAASDTLTIRPTDVYIAGQKDNQACYWKNNQPVLLESGGIQGPVATKIMVANNDVYVLGIGVAADQLFPIPMFWKNGVLTNLKTSLSTDEEEVMSITDFEVVGNDVYFTGYTRKTLIAFENFSLFCWKNNIPNLVHNYGGFASNPSKIKIANNMVYITASHSGSEDINGYYANNSFVQIPNSFLNGFAISNNQVYIYGSLNNTNYYKNITTNSETTIPLDSNGITGMLFENNNTYFTDGSNNIYKNGNLFDEGQIPGGSVRDFKILNGNVYKVTQAGDFGYNSFLTINGVETMEIPNSEGSFQSVYVVQN